MEQLRRMNSEKLNFQVFQRWVTWVTFKSNLNQKYFNVSLSLVGAEVHLNSSTVFVHLLQDNFKCYISDHENYKLAGTPWKSHLAAMPRLSWRPTACFDQ